MALSPKQSLAELDFHRVCDMLHAGHGGSPDRPTPLHTLNELFQKHLKGHQPQWHAGAPWLTASNVTVSIEVRAKPDSRLPHPLYMHLPVVIVRYRGTDCLIDGGSRVYAWEKAGDTNTHPACVLAVKAD
jgi:hypothetical protein